MASKSLFRKPFIASIYEVDGMYSAFERLTSFLIAFSSGVSN